MSFTMPQGDQVDYGGVGQFDTVGVLRRENTVTGPTAANPDAPAAPAAPAAEKDTSVFGDARAAFSRLLSSLGLSSLEEGAWQRIQMGDSENQLLQWVQNTGEYKARYSGLVTLRERAARGEPVSVMDEGQYNTFIGQAESMMRFYGLPKDFYDTRDDLGKFVAGNVSLRELEERVTNGYAQVQNAPQSVRDAFAEMHGAKGDAQLAAFFLDPDKQQSVYDKAVRESTALGYARNAGANLTAAGARRIGDLNISAEEARRGAAELANLNDAMAESISETQDLTVDKEGVDAVFGGNIAPIRKRLEERQAAFGGSGGAAQTRTGLGLGDAN